MHNKINLILLTLFISISYIIYKKILTFITNKTQWSCTCSSSVSSSINKKSTNTDIILDSSSKSSSSNSSSKSSSKSNKNKFINLIRSSNSSYKSKK